MEIFYPGRGKCMDEDLPQSAEVLGKLGFCVGWGPDAVFQLSNYLEGVAAELTRYGYALEIADRDKAGRANGISQAPRHRKAYHFR